MKYCVYCGKENREEEKKCISCGKVLDAKDHLLKEYIKAHLLEEGSGKVLDTFKDVAQAFVKKYLYGIVLSLSIVATSTSLLFHQTSEETSGYQTVSSAPSVSVQYIGEGLDGNTIANRYASLIQENDLASAQAYQLDWYYPQLLEGGHAVYEQRDIYFKGYDQNATLVDFDGERVMRLVESLKPVYTDTCHHYEALGYHCDGATFEITYAYPNTFIAQKKLIDEIGAYAYQQSGMPHRENGPYFYTLLLAFYAVEVDGNYYIVKDEAQSYRVYPETYYREFMEAKGDVSKMSFLKEYHE